MFCILWSEDFLCRPPPRVFVEAPSKTDLFSVEHELIEIKPKMSIVFLIIDLLSFGFIYFYFFIESRIFSLNYENYEGEA